MPHDFALHACPEFLADFTDFVDGSLSLGRRSEIQAHLDCCEGCLRHLSAYRRGIGAYRELELPGVDPDEFWLGLRIRLASDDAVTERKRSFAWRAPAMAGAAVALVALATVWLGLRIDAGFQRIADRPVAAAGDAAPVAAAVNGADANPADAGVTDFAGADPAESAVARGVPAERAVQIASVSQPSRTAPSRTALSRATGARTAIPDPAIEREFEQLREEIEVAAWLGDPYLEASDRAFVPRDGGVRIQTAGWTY